MVLAKTWGTPNYGVVSKIVKHGGRSIMAWSCIVSERVGERTVIEGRTNNKHYWNILHDNISMSAVKFGKEVDEWVFQDYSTSK